MLAEQTDKQTCRHASQYFIPLSGPKYYYR